MTTENRERLHDCGDGRWGTLEEEITRTDEGIIVELTCMSCWTIVSKTFEEYSPEEKEGMEQESFNFHWERRIQRETT